MPQLKPTTRLFFNSCAGKIKGKIKEGNKDVEGTTGTVCARPGNGNRGLEECAGRLCAGLQRGEEGSCGAAENTVKCGRKPGL